MNGYGVWMVVLSGVSSRGFSFGFLEKCVVKVQ